MALPRAELHLHTDFSLLDGLGKIPQYVAQAQESGVVALGLTDHGTLGGAYEHYTECRRAGIEPLIGEEFYFVPSATEAKQFKDSERFHVGIIAKNERGYRVLKELNDEAHRNFYYKPLLDRSMLENLGRDARHLVCLSGCAGSIISRSILDDKKPEEVHDELKWWTSIFPNFYVELQHHGCDFDSELIVGLLELAVGYDLPTVITNDCHYVAKADAADHDALLAVQVVRNIDDPDRFRFNGAGYHLKTRSELRRAFLRDGIGDEWVKEGMRNSLRIARDCHTRIPGWENRTWHIPKFPGTDDAQGELRRLTIAGLRAKGKLSDPRYVDRAKHELREIRSVGIADFLLLCHEPIAWAQAEGIRVGPGRGSIAGCLVAYAIGMHKLDPIRYNTKFERFLNPERPKMPDVDTDFGPSRRDEVVEHLKELHGVDNVIQVAAYQTMKVKGTFRKLAKAHGIEWNEINRISKILNPAGGHPDDDEDDEDISVLPAELREAYPDLHEQIKGLIGTKSGLSSHAAGLLIFAPNDPIKELVPKMWLTNQKKLAASFDLKSTEKIGLMKLDCLTVRTLDTVTEAVRILHERGIDVEPDDWVPDEEDDDRGVYAMLAEGRTAGVFQMEGGTNSRGIQEIRPTCFEDIISCTSLYRAGPIGAGAPARYLKNKRRKQIRVAHPLLRPILASSWGEMIYQEQMMDICHDVAGFSWAETDDVKETVRFKDPERMAGFQQRFIAGCQQHSGMDHSSASEIWSMIESQSTYLFNRSHAGAYSLLTYQAARLKYLYPLEFMTAYLATVEADTDVHKANRQRVLSEAHELGIKILAPDINQSEAHMCCGSDEDSRWMRFGFVDIKGIGESKAAKVLRVRQTDPGGFYGVSDVVSAVDKGALATLGACGALASIGGPKVKTHQIENYVDWDFTDRMAPWRKRLRREVKFPSRDGEWAQIAGELIAVEKRTTKTNRPFRVWTLRWSPSELFTVTLWEDAQACWDTSIGSIVAVEGKYSRDFGNIGIGDSDYVNVLHRRVASGNAASTKQSVGT